MKQRTDCEPEFDFEASGDECELEGAERADDDTDCAHLHFLQTERENVDAQHDRDLRLTADVAEK